MFFGMAVSGLFWSAGHKVLPQLHISFDTGYTPYQLGKWNIYFNIYTEGHVSTRFWSHSACHPKTQQLNKVGLQLWEGTTGEERNSW